MPSDLRELGENNPQPSLDGSVETPTTRALNPPADNQLDAYEGTNYAPKAEPRIASLAAIFPDFDHAVLSDVLDLCNGSQDRAIEILLGMNDPSYAPRTSDTTQSELDEQLAHRLAAEEREDFMRYIPPPSATYPYTPRAPRRSNEHARPVEDVPLQTQFRDYFMPSSTRHRGVNDPEGASSRTGGDFQEQFTRIADTGKRTFNNIFSKVKAKLQEFDTPASQHKSSAASTSSAPPRTQPEAYYAPPKQVTLSTSPPNVNDDDGYDLTPQAPLPIRTGKQVHLPPSEANTYLFEKLRATAKGWHRPTPRMLRSPNRHQTDPHPLQHLRPSHLVWIGVSVHLHEPPTAVDLQPFAAYGGKLGLLPRRPRSLIVDDLTAPGPHHEGKTSSPSQDDDDDRKLVL
ncbi:uncharacterized protein EI90DRAFT_3156560 [Cantharellus anzutake]|uniref:uncharacterized protein n=1 Tax=Cantharellus anzutake TaxID=1750568 RepID=UPI001903AA9D|nr:uncharacterized protein EI90DRAFT_3156560 [Cantharellus anzutake]KAF8326652.1 hypothetical protein EI90DRAFT_3156560 [Cantharellus anzutake]